MIAAAVMILAMQGGATPATPAPPPLPGPAAGGWLADAAARRVRRNPPLGPVPPDPTNRWADDEAAARRQPSASRVSAGNCDRVSAAPSALGT
ncbi:MAG: hypothetical protein ACKOTD_09650, partial [Phycisphaerales bacterium]